ncbi:MAG: DASS family sodium-coupled anion symporter [Melioribacteraceae bacterium]|nr:DASS family sodium-coupled anion symporter [Melioribacteraceae bacterium]
MKDEKIVSEKVEISNGSNGEDLENLLDLDKHKLSVIPEKKSSQNEKWLKYLGVPVSIIVFLYLYYMPTPTGLTASGQVVIAAFMFALILWVTEAIPTHVTSLILMILLVFFNGWEMKNVLGVLGFDVIWLNVLAFILSSLLVKTNIAKRIALNLIVKFGSKALPMLLAFILLQLALAPLIPATAARTVITLPIMLIVASIYGSTSDAPNNFGKNLFLQNLFGINIFSSGFMTGSTANLIAVSFIFSMANTKVYYTDWMFANLPVVIIAMLIAWYLGPKYFFKLKKEETTPKVKGGIDSLKKQLDSMGKMSAMEKKGAFIFGLVVFLWVTDRFHTQLFGFQIDPVMAAMVGAVITLLPKVGLLKWNECDIPWHLMLFSAGAYAGGLALNDTGAAKWAVQNLFQSFNLNKEINFWVIYIIIISVMMYSHLVFTSKTMRTIILIPFTIALSKELGINPIALALPAAFTIDWVIGLPISAKPNVILFTTGQYSVLDNLKYGIIMSTIGIILLLIAGLTWFRFLGITP